MSQTHVSLLGCGWLGVAFAHDLQKRGVHVRGSTTHSSRVSLLTSIGVEPLLLRLDGGPSVASELVDDASVRAFFSSPTLVVSIPPEVALGREFHLGQIRTLLDLVQTIGSCRHLVYISSTSVYGAHQGVVDETTVCQPDGESGAILLEAETLLREFASAHKETVGVTVVRPGGFIGPGRHPGLFLAGRKDVKNGDAPVNLIQQLDLSLLVTSLICDHPTAPGSFEIYNAVSSDHPTRAEFYSRAARAIGVEPPTFQAPASEHGSGLDGKTLNSKIVVADKIRRVTGVPSRFTTLYDAIGAVSV